MIDSREGGWSGRLRKMRVGGGGGILTLNGGGDDLVFRTSLFRVTSSWRLMPREGISHQYGILRTEKQAGVGLNPEQKRRKRNAFLHNRSHLKMREKVKGIGICTVDKLRGVPVDLGTS